jgi:RNA polymerase sigma-70 factor, ECF subfamily
VDHVEEHDWVRRARTGDRAAFTALVDLYWPRIHRWLSGLLRRGGDAEDLTQDVFVKAWLALPQLHGDEHFRPWLFRIARNLAIDSRRGPRGLPPQPLPNGLAAQHAEPDRAALEEEADRLLQAALDALSPTNRAAYLLWTQEELPYGEIAQVLGVTEETARWRVCKARKSLATELAAYLDRNPT